MNNKGWLRIAEAFIAIMIVASVLVVMATRTSREDTGGNIHELQRHLLKQISANNILRAQILQDITSGTENFLDENMPTNLDYEINICEINEACGMEEYIDKEIYADEILISATLSEYNPKKLKLFVWVR